MKTIRQVFTHNLKEQRERAGLDQVEFAQLLGVPPSTYQKLESSKGGVPQKKTIAKIVEVLKLPSETVLFMDPDYRLPALEDAIKLLARQHGFEIVRKLTK